MIAKKNYHKPTARRKDMAQQRVDVVEHGEKDGFPPLPQKRIGGLRRLIHRSLEYELLHNVSKHGCYILRVTN